MQLPWSDAVAGGHALDGHSLTPGHAWFGYFDDPDALSRTRPAQLEETQSS